MAEPWRRPRRTRGAKRRQSILQAHVEAVVERLQQQRERAKLMRRRDILKGNGQERP